MYDSVRIDDGCIRKHLHGPASFTPLVLQLELKPSISRIRCMVIVSVVQNIVGDPVGKCLTDEERSNDRAKIFTLEAASWSVRRHPFISWTPSYVEELCSYVTIIYWHMGRKVKLQNDLVGSNVMMKKGDAMVKKETTGTNAPYTVSAREVVAETPDLRVVLMTLAEGESTRWHYHSRIVDTFFCLEGILEVHTKRPDATVILKPGDSYAVSSPIAHRAVNAGRRCRFLLVQGVGTYDFHAIDG